MCWLYNIYPLGSTFESPKRQEPYVWLNHLFSRRTVPACQQRRSPESRAHHFISMINTLHFMRIILRPLHPHVRELPKPPIYPRASPRHPARLLVAFLTPSSDTYVQRGCISPCSSFATRRPAAPPPSGLRPLSAPPPPPPRPPTPSCPALSRVRPSVQPPPPRTQPIFFNVRQL